MRELRRHGLRHVDAEIAGARQGILEPHPFADPDDLALRERRAVGDGATGEVAQHEDAEREHHIDGLALDVHPVSERQTRTDEDLLRERGHAEDSTGETSGWARVSDPGSPALGWAIATQEVSISSPGRSDRIHAGND